MPEIQLKRSVGRPLSETGASAKSAVSDFVSSRGSDGFTIGDVVDATGLDKTFVKNHVNLLVRGGKLYRIPSGCKKGVGRPMTVFKTL